MLLLDKVVIVLKTIRWKETYENNILEHERM